MRPVAEQAGEKKHEATPYRRAKAREEGNVARSQDLGSAVLLLVGVVALDWFGPGLYGQLMGMVRSAMAESTYTSADPRTQIALLARLGWASSTSLLPLLGVMLTTAVVVHVGQTGLLWLPDKLNIDPSRINPLQGFSRLFSVANASRLGFGLFKIAVVVLVLGIGLWLRWDELLALGGQRVEGVGAFVWTTTIDLVRQAALALVGLALLDFGFQKWKYENDLRMTDEDLREEMKATQGDPQTKARRRRVAKQIAAQRLQADVPKADVVVTNPTHLAVALQYDPKTMKAPVVVAKGAELIAARIRQLALSHGIPVIERKPLAQALFKSVEIGQSIPFEHYAAVAELLKYVYQVKGRSVKELIQ